MSKITLYDRDGRPYQMSPAEAKKAVDSGAYSMTRNGHEKKDPKVVDPTAGKKFLWVKEIKTGKLYEMAAIDAREAVKTKFFEYAPDSPTIAPRIHESEKIEQEPAEVEKDEIKAPESGNYDMEIMGGNGGKVADQEIEQAPAQNLVIKRTKK